MKRNMFSHLYETIEALKRLEAELESIHQSLQIDTTEDEDEDEIE